MFTHPTTRPLTRTALSLCTIAVLITGGILYAGPLTPPAGPVASTYKTLTEVEPRIAINATNTPASLNGTYSIYQPGSYYLTGNITGEIAKHGIMIAADGVTIDLCGFTLTGVPGSYSGVGHSVNSYRNVTVLNGTVTGWGGSGISIAGAGNRVERVRSSSNASTGIALLANGIVESCTVTDNGSHGISVGAGGVVRGCAAYSNNANGFSSVGNATFTDCSASNNATGFSVGTGSKVTGCTSRDNTADGIVGAAGCIVSNCSVYSNGGNGISVDSGSSVVDCTVQYSTLDGIRCGNTNFIRGNTCSFNGNGSDGANIHATGGDNRIEDNNCTGADRGVDVDAAGNFITKNTCSGNTTNWDVVANNKCLVVLGANAGAILGNSGGVAPGSTDPNANFTY